MIDRLHNIGMQLFLSSLGVLADVLRAGEAERAEACAPASAKELIEKSGQPNMLEGRELVLGNSRVEYPTARDVPKPETTEQPTHGPSPLAAALETIKQLRAVVGALEANLANPTTVFLLREEHEIK